MNTCQRNVDYVGCERGFTLIELLFTAVILVVLLSLGAPMLRNLVLDQRVKTAASDVHGALIFARSEALKRNADIAVVISSGTDWAVGWDVKVGTTVLRHQDAFVDMTIASTDQDANNVTTLTYRGDGRLSGTAIPSFAVRSTESSITARCVQLDLSGRPNIKVGC